MNRNTHSEACTYDSLSSNEKSEVWGGPLATNILHTDFLGMHMADQVDGLWWIFELMAVHLNLFAAGKSLAKLLFKTSQTKFKRSILPDGCSSVSKQTRWSQADGASCDQGLQAQWCEWDTFLSGCMTCMKAHGQCCNVRAAFEGDMKYLAFNTCGVCGALREPGCPGTLLSAPSEAVQQ